MTLEETFSDYKQKLDDARSANQKLDEANKNKIAAEREYFSACEQLDKARDRLLSFGIEAAPPKTLVSC